MGVRQHKGPGGPCLKSKPHRPGGPRGYGSSGRPAEAAVRCPAAAGPQAVVAADFNGDGKLDLALTSGGTTVSVLLGNGDGTFRPAVNFATGSGPRSIAVGDFNGDGNLDIVTANASDVSV